MIVDAKKSSGSSDPLVGKVVHDRFRIISPIARGGMGAVYKAEQAPLGRLVAIKVLSPRHDEDKDPEFRKRFFLEAATVAKLSHPNTVTVFDYGQSDGLYFIAMELIDGITLKKALKLDGPFPPWRAVHVTKQIARSLREAHRLGVIHRDMKPGNVMLVQQGDEQDYVKVLDFGLVKEVEAEDEEDLTQAGVFMGSPKYMSPEQIRGDRVDARSDVYSVGVILYEMLAGAPPFVQEKQVQILMDHINSPVPPLRSQPGRPPIPEPLAQIVYKCLAKAREERFDDMEQLLNALKHAAGELSMVMPSSAELGLTGDYPLSHTPISGIHTLAHDASHAHSGPPPIITGATPASLAVQTHGPVSSVSVAPAVADVPSSRTKIALLSVGGIALLGALGLGILILDPFAQPEIAAVPMDDRAAPDPTEDPELPPVGAQRDQGSSPVEPVAPAARSLIVDLDSQPPGAMVRVGEQEYGPTPAQVELTGEMASAGRELTFVFHQEGFRDITVTRTVPEQGALDVVARLRRNFVPTRPGGSQREGGEGAEQDVTPAGYRESPY